MDSQQFFSRNYQQTLNDGVLSIVLESIGENENALEVLKIGGGLPPWADESHRAQAIAECQQGIERDRELLADPFKMETWWNAIPEDQRLSLINM